MGYNYTVCTKFPAYRGLRLQGTPHDLAVTLKMHDLKMTDKENYGSGKCRTGK